MDIKPQHDNGAQRQFFFVPNGSILLISPRPHNGPDAWVRIWVDGKELPDPEGRAAHHVQDQTIIPIETDRKGGAEVGLMVTSWPNSDVAAICRT